jgi:KAP family P-loop domain
MAVELSRYLNRILPQKKEKPPKKDEALPQGYKFDIDRIIDDQPIDDAHLDELGRNAFSDRVAALIIEDTSSKSKVIGIYGSWGSGKTTLLNLIEQELQRYISYYDTVDEDQRKESFTIVRFEPWYLDDEASIQRAFFQALAPKQAKQKNKRRDKKSEPDNLGRLFRSYGEILASASAANGVQPRRSRKRKSTVGQPTYPLLESVKKKIQAELMEKRKRYVILIDDIDKLDADGMQMMLKLVKLVADFPFNTYVLAFDDVSVSEVLGERYGGDLTSGQTFLEKIVQLPLRLPKPDEELFATLCTDLVKKVLSNEGIELERLPADALMMFRNQLKNVLPGLRTPRHAKKWANSLAFVLPNMVETVYLPDLMLIEAMKVAYPKLFERIVNYREFFLGLEDRPEVLEEGLKELSPEERQAAKSLTEELFPNLGQRSVPVPDEGPEEKDLVIESGSKRITVSKKNRISSPGTLHTYLTRSDRSFDARWAFLADCSRDSNPYGIAARIKTEREKYDAETLINKILRDYRKTRQQNWDVYYPHKMAVGMSIAADSFSSEYSSDKGADSVVSRRRPDAVFLKLAAAVREFLAYTQTAKLRADAIEKIFENSPLPFAVVLFDSFQTNPRSEKGDVFLSKEASQKWGKYLSDKITESITQQVKLGSLGNPFLQQGGFKLWTWRLLLFSSQWGSGRVKQDITDLLNASQFQVEDIFECMLEGQRVLVPGSLEKPGVIFNQVSRIVDAKVAYNAILLTYGERFVSTNVDEGMNQIKHAALVFCKSYLESMDGA